MKISLVDSRFASMIDTMKPEEQSSSCMEDFKDEELSYETSSAAELQFRNVVLQACWRDELGLAEVIEQNGHMLTSMGIVRNGNIYCSIEETLFLAEIGALLLIDDKDTTIPLKKIYEKVAEGKSGCSWEDFEVYRHLKSLGYIVKRHDVQWSLKGARSCFIPAEENPKKDNYIQTLLDKVSNLQLLEDSQVRELKPVFDVYPPNSKFKKTSPGDPYFILYVARDYLPSRCEIEQLERKCNVLPLKIGHVEHGRVSIFSFDKVELPVLP